jgi:hypothetical protein
MKFPIVAEMQPSSHFTFRRYRFTFDTFIVYIFFLRDNPIRVAGCLMKINNFIP